MVKKELPTRNRSLTFCLLIIMALVIGGWGIFLGLGNRLLKSMHRGEFLSFFNMTQGYSSSWSLYDLSMMAEKILILFTWISGIIVIGLFWRRALIRGLCYVLRVDSAEELKKRIFSISIWLGSSWLCFITMYSFGYVGEGPLDIETIMRFSSGPPYQHRILFIGVANIFKTLFPNVSYLGCYFLSQAIPILLTFYFIKTWGEFFIAPRLAFLAQILLVLLLIPTFKYYTFYDIGIVLFYTLSLVFLFKGRFYLYLLVLILGTLNHEITLFLVFMFAAMYYKSDLKRTTYWGFIVVQFIFYGATRLWLFYLLPMPEAWGGGRVWFNVNFIVNPDRRLFFVILNLLFWYLIAFLGFKAAPQKLKRCAVLFPLLWITTFLVGQFNEIRQFDAFIPVVIGFVLVYIARLSFGDGST